ncbi:MAG: thiol peroxidase [Spirochaetaceae bacterium]|jgi:thiol peroxidase|nr:thiol peroxidase [Spirochaetaceae bacterium]
MPNLEGNPITLSGSLPGLGENAPDFSLVNGELQQVSLSQFIGERVVLNIFPSIDTDVCATSVREFENRALNEDNVRILAISKDLPFAQKRFCINQNIQKVHTLSGFRDTDFGKNYGLDILDSPIAGLYARAVVVVDEKGRVIHSQMVPEISQEPNYKAALDSLKST